MAVDECLITAPRYYRPEAREEEILIAGRGSRVRGYPVRTEQLDAIG